MTARNFAAGTELDAAAVAPSDWTRAPERSNMAALRLICWVAVTCGRRVTRAALHLVTLYFVLFSSGARKQSKRYLARALGRKPTIVDGYRHVHAFAATVLDRVFLLRGRLDGFDVRMRGAELIDAVLDEGRGAFLVGAHVGSFEVLREVGGQRPGLKVAMVMYPDNARMVNAALRAVAPDFEPDIIALGRMDSMLALRDWLDAGGLAGLLADRTLPGAKAERGGMVKVDFLGKEAEFSDAPFRLAALLRRKVMFMAGLYAGGARYDVRFETLADFSERIAEPAERERRVQEAVVVYARRLEALCREYPFNWFNFHDFWREDDPA